MKISEAVSQQFLQLLSGFSKDGLSVGDRFTGRILAITDGVLLMQLSDGSQIHAQVKSGAEYSSGDILKLEAVAVQDDRLLVREVTPEQVRAEALDPVKLLKGMKLPTDDSRIEIVKAMLDMGTRPSALMVEKAVSLLEAKQISQPEQAAFLVLNAMEDKEAYFPLIRELDAQNFHFQEKWQSILAQVAKLDDNLVLEIADRFVTDEILKQQDLAALSKQITSLIESDGNEKPVSENTINDTLRAVLEELIALDTKHGELFSAENTYTLKHETPASIARRNFSGMKRLDKSVQDEVVEALLDLSSRVVQEKNNRPLSSDRAKEIVLRAGRELSPGMTVKTSESEVPKIDQWIEDIEKKLQVISETVAKSGNSSGESIQSGIRELQTAVRFFNDISCYETYVQIPLVVKEKTTRGELYIMKRKGLRRKLNAEDFTLFLSLSTMNLGTIDIFIHVRNKNVMMRTMVEHERFHGLLMDEYKSLHEALKVKGFRLYELKVSPREEALDLFNAEKKAREITKPYGKVDVKI
jgi:hypothetical protein